jgi:hypothetical protein
VTVELSRRRDHLRGNRRMILGRALVGTALATVPLPLVDDYLVEVTLGSGYRRIARTRHVDVDDRAVAGLVHGRTQARSWTKTAVFGIASRVLSRTWLRALAALATAQRARAAARTYVTMTLFDHYCARHHVGAGLDGERALVVRDVIAAAIAATPGALSFEPFRRGAALAARATLRAPLELADLASGGRLRGWLDRRREVAEPEAVTALEQAIEAEMAGQDGFFARAVTAIELQLSADTNPYLDAVLDRFDALWAARASASPGGSP